MDNKLEISGIENVLQLVTFSVGDEEFGVDILKVQEINRMTDITRVPNTHSYVVGVINLRGKVIPIIDLRSRLCMAKVDNSKDTRIVVVELEHKVIGFIVDKVNEVIRVNKDITEPPPPTTAGISSEFITAIGKIDNRLLILLDLEKILEDEELELEKI